MMVSRVSLQALSKQPPYSNLLPYKELARGVPIHVPFGSATAQVNITCIFDNTDC